MIIRIDDYPTGIRPILPNHIEEFKPILNEFENAKIHYYLGIVPGICTSEDWGFLNSLKYMIPACHGYDHLYPFYSPILTEYGDEYNEKGIGGSDNEFNAQNFKDTFRRISDGVDLLRNNLLRNTYAFIPPYNNINEHVEEALLRKQITLLLGETPALKNIYTISSLPFYNWSNELVELDIKKATCITLHLTWEWDLIRKGDNESLKKFVERLKNEL